METRPQNRSEFDEDVIDKYAEELEGIEYPEPEIGFSDEQISVMGDLNEMFESISVLRFHLAKEEERKQATVNLLSYMGEGTIDKGFKLGVLDETVAVLRDLSLLGDYQNTANAIALYYLDELEKYSEEAHVRQNGFRHAQVMDIFAGMARSRDQNTSRVGLEVLVKNRDLIRNSYGSENFQFYLRVIEALIKKGAGSFEPKLISAALQGRIENGLSIYLGRLYESQTFELHEVARKTITKILGETANLPVTEIIQAWHSSDKSIGSSIDRNVNRVLNLERAKPGSAKILSEEFGICDFGRYPLELLVDQYEYRDRDVPYGAIIYPFHDHNGAFYQDQEAFEGLMRSLEGKYHLRVVEADGKYQLARRLVGLNNRYGKQNLISFGIIGGHGTKESISFGNTEKDKAHDSLYPIDLMYQGAQRSRDFFIPDCTLVLVSCSTGQNEGIGQRLSEVFGCEVIAPDTPTNLSQIAADISGDRVKLFVEYGKNDPGIQYLAGEHQSGEK